MSLNQHAVNQARFTAKIIQASITRYTPSGVPVLEVELDHDSLIDRDGEEQSIAFTIQASAVGSIANVVSALKLGDVYIFDGYWAPAHYRTKKIQFHILNVHTNET